MTATTLPHGPIEQLAENLWTVEGSLRGISIKRRMVVARDERGGLVIHSAIAMSEPQMTELEALGRPAVLLVPNAYHRLDAPKYKARYPELRVLCPARSRKKVAERVAVDGTYDDFVAEPSIELRTLQGTTAIEGVMLVRSKDGVTVVLNDVVFNMDARRDVVGWLFTTLMGSAPGPRMSRLARFALVKDRALLRRELTALADEPGLVRVVVAHDKVAHGADAATTIRHALRDIS